MTQASRRPALFGLQADVFVKARAVKLADGKIIVGRADDDHAALRQPDCIDGVINWNGLFYSRADADALALAWVRRFGRPLQAVRVSFADLPDER